MTILCGTDFSPVARDATRVAGLLACASQQGIHLVHVLWEAPGPLATGSSGSIPAEISRALEEEAGVLGPGRPVVTRAVRGRPEQALVELSRQLHASLVIVGAVGHGALERWLVGSCANGLARDSTVPVLVVRDPRPFEQWVLHRRPLRVLVGCEAGPSSNAAVSWAGSLEQIAPIELTLARLVLPGDENRRADTRGPGMGLTLSAEAEAEVREELLARKQRLLGEREARLRVIPTLGRLDQRLVLAAEESGADLIVLGSHQREGFRRWWHGSVSNGVLNAARVSVAVVPLGATLSPEVQSPPMTWECPRPQPA